MGGVQTTVALRVEPIVIALRCESVEDAVTVGVAGDVCITNKPFRDGLGCTVVTSRITMNASLRPALRAKVEACLHVNTANGLREENAAFTTALLDIAKSSVEVDVRVLDKYFAFQKACSETWREVSLIYGRPTKQHDRAARGECQGDARTQVAPLHVVGAPSNMGNLFPKKSPHGQSPTIFLRTRAGKFTCSIKSIGTHLNVTMRLDGIESRFADLGSRVGDRRGAVNLFLFVKSVGCSVDGRLQGHVKCPGLMLQGARDYSSMPVCAASARGWQPWLSEKISLNWISGALGKAHAHGEMKLSSQGMLVMNAASTGAIGAKFADQHHNNACIISALFFGDALRVQITYDSPS